MARRRHRSAAQKAATRRLVALNRARRRSSNPVRRRRRARRRNPITKAAAYRTMSSMTGRAANPVRRRRRRKVYASNPRRVHRRRRRRNPLSLPRGGKIMGLIGPAATAASGAVLLDILMAYLTPYLPAQVNAGAVRVLTKAAGAVGLSMLASKFLSPSTGRAMGVGALTVVFYDLAKQLITQVAPAVKMDGMGYYSPAYPAGGYMDGVGVYVGPGGTARSGLPNMGGMGEYVNGMARFDNEHSYYNV